MITRCWTVWKALAASRPRNMVAAVTPIRRARRARRAATATVVLYPTIVCSVIGVGSTAGMLFPWRDGSTSHDQNYNEFAYNPVGLSASELPQPIPVSEPESLLLLGTALFVMLIIAVCRKNFVSRRKRNEAY